jgi:hypothetical protein
MEAMGALTRAWFSVLAAVTGSPLPAAAAVSAAAGQAAQWPARSRATLIHKWRSFFPTDPAWPVPSIGYAVDQNGVRRSADGGRTWLEGLTHHTSLPQGGLLATRPSAPADCRETRARGR